MTSTQEDHVAEQPAAPVVVHREGAIATIQLNRPESMNSLDVATKVALRDALAQTAADVEVRVVVLTGSGRAFCVGQDLKEHLQNLQAAANNPGGPADAGVRLDDTVTEHYNPIVELIATMDKPVIAALNGVAAGAGASFALAADLRIAAETSGINLAFAGIALSCDSGASWSLPRLIGTAKAKELLLMPRTVPASEARDLGLVTEVVPDAEFADRVAQVAGQLAAGPTRAYGAIRRSVAFSAGQPLTEALAFEARQMAATGGSADHGIAVQAFLAKEKPDFIGR